MILTLNINGSPHEVDCAPADTLFRVIRGLGYYGVKFADLEVEARLREGSTEIRQGRARVGGGTVSFKGVVTEDGVYDGAATANRYSTSAVASLTRPSPSSTT